MIIPHVLLHPPREDFIVIYGCSCLLEHIRTHSTLHVTLSQHWHQEESPGNFAAVFLENPMRKQIAWWPPFTSMFKPDRCVTYSAVSSTLLIICSLSPTIQYVRTSVMGGFHLWPPFLLELHTFCVLYCALRWCTLFILQGEEDQALTF